MKGLKFQLKSQIFDRSDPITILGFVPAFQMMCDMNGLHKGVTRWSSHHFTKKSAAAVPSARPCPTSSCKSLQEEYLTSYFEVISYLLSTYATDDKLADADAEIIKCKQPQDLNAVDYLQSLRKRALNCSPVHN